MTPQKNSQQPKSTFSRNTLALFAISTIFLCNGVLLGTWAINIPELRDQFGLKESQVGLVLLCIGLGSLISMPLTGNWTARFGSNRVTHIAVVLCMLSLLLPFVAPNVLALVAGLIVVGMCNGCLDVAMNAQGVTIEQALARPVISRLHAFFSLGSVIGAGVGSLLIGRVPILTLIVLVVLVTTALGLLVGRWLILDPVQSQVTAEEKQISGSVINSAVWFLGALCFLGMLSEGANYDWAALYFRDVLHVKDSLSGLGYTAFVTTMTLGRFLGDYLRGRIGNERIVRGGAALTASGMALVLLVHNPIAGILGFALAGFGLSNVVPVMYGTAGHALAGKGIAKVATIGYLGFLIGPTVIGFVAQKLGLPIALSIAALGAGLVALLGAQAFQIVNSISAAKGVGQAQASQA